jgi:hypothetical protein
MSGELIVATVEGGGAMFRFPHSIRRASLPGGPSIEHATGLSERLARLLPVVRASQPAPASRES